MKKLFFVKLCFLNDFCRVYWFLIFSHVFTNIFTSYSEKCIYIFNLWRSYKGLSEYWNIYPVQACSTSHPAGCHSHLKNILMQKWPTLTFFKIWWTSTLLRHPVYANFDIFQNVILLNIKTNVLTVAPWKYSFKVVMQKKYTGQNTPFYSSEWVIFYFSRKWWYPYLIKPRRRWLITMFSSRK